MRGLCAVYARTLLAAKCPSGYARRLGEVWAKKLAAWLLFVPSYCYYFASLTDTTHQIVKLGHLANALFSCAPVQGIWSTLMREPRVSA